ncbi:hypothetical protein AE1304_04650 [Aeromonas enteropelogenes]
MHSIEWYSVQVMYTDRVPFALYGELEKGGIYISAGGRLCGPGKGVYLQSESLAEAYVAALIKRRNKIDPHFKARVVLMSSNYARYRDFIERDTSKVREKLSGWGVQA